MWRLVAACLLLLSVAAAQLTSTQVPFTDYAPRPTASVAGLQTTVTPSTASTSTITLPAASTVAQTIPPQQAALTAQQQTQLNTGITQLGQQAAQILRELFGTNTQAQAYAQQQYNPYAAQYNAYAQYNPYAAQQYSAQQQYAYAQPQPSVFTTQAVSTSTDDGALQQYPSGMIDCPAHWERRWGLGPACRPRQHNNTFIPSAVNHTNGTAQAYAVIERVERIVLSNDTDPTNSSIIAVETIVTDILIPLNSTDNSTSADSSVSADDADASDSGGGALFGVLSESSTERHNRTSSHHRTHHNRTHSSNSTLHRFDTLANRHRDRDSSSGISVHQFSTQAAPSLPSLPSFDWSNPPSFDSSMISTGFSSAMTQMPSMMAAVQPIIAQIQANPPTSAPPSPYQPQSYGSSVNLGSNPYALPTTAYGGSYAGATPYAGYTSVAPYTAATAAASSATTPTDPVAIAESMGITYQHYNDPTTLHANAPVPAATCAVTDVHCQMYKSCYSCYSNPTPMCTSCLALAQCTDLACQIQQSCAVCSATNQSAQMVCTDVCRSCDNC